MRGATPKRRISRVHSVQAESVIRFVETLFGGGKIVQEEPEQASFGPSEIGALVHLYRGEMYQSKIWRVRLDVTTNWAVVATGIAMSVTFSVRRPRQSRYC
jgi:uncharacterized membrane protein